VFSTGVPTGHVDHHLKLYLVVKRQHLEHHQLHHRQGDRQQDCQQDPDPQEAAVANSFFVGQKRQQQLVKTPVQLSVFVHGMRRADGVGL
jgi:hypothetical protein